MMDGQTDNGEVIPVCCHYMYFVAGDAKKEMSRTPGETLICFTCTNKFHERNICQCNNKCFFKELLIDLHVFLQISVV